MNRQPAQGVLSMSTCLPISSLLGLYAHNPEPVLAPGQSSECHPVSLFLPALQFAEQSLMKNAIKTSEESWIEQQMLEDKKRATDWEATNEAIEEQVARESYLQWLRDQEKQARQVRGPSQVSPGLCHWPGQEPLTSHPLPLYTQMKLSSFDIWERRKLSARSVPHLGLSLGIVP